MLKNHIKLLSFEDGTMFTRSEFEAKIDPVFFRLDMCKILMEHGKLTHINGEPTSDKLSGMTLNALESEFGESNVKTPKVSLGNLVDVDLKEGNGLFFADDPDTYTKEEVDKLINEATDGIRKLVDSDEDWVRPPPPVMFNSETPPPRASAGDMWLVPSTNHLFIAMSDGADSVSEDGWLRVDDGPKDEPTKLSEVTHKSLGSKS